MKILREFREFALKGNVVDMAIGIIIGAGFGKIVSSLVSDVLMPPIGMVAGKVDFSQVVIPLSDKVNIRIGVFLNTVIDFAIVAFVIFLIVQRMNKLKAYLEPVKAPEPPTKICPECLSKIPAEAKKCAFCTSTLPV